MCSFIDIKQSLTYNNFFGVEVCIVYVNIIYDELKWMNGVNHMNEKNRVFGNNVKLFISDKNLSEQTVAEHLGYSKYDLWKIMDGRLFLDEDEKRDIAEELQTTVEDLYMPRSEEKYHAAGCIECRGEFRVADYS